MHVYMKIERWHKYSAEKHMHAYSKSQWNHNHLLGDTTAHFHDRMAPGLCGVANCQGNDSFYVESNEKKNFTFGNKLKMSFSLVLTNKNQSRRICSMCTIYFFLHSVCLRFFLSSAFCLKCIYRYPEIRSEMKRCVYLFPIRIWFQFLLTFAMKSANGAAPNALKHLFNFFYIVFCCIQGWVKVEEVVNAHKSQMVVQTLAAFTNNHSVCGKFFHIECAFEIEVDKQTVRETKPTYLSACEFVKQRDKFEQVNKRCSHQIHIVDFCALNKSEWIKVHRNDMIIDQNWSFFT